MENKNSYFMLDIGIPINQSENNNYQEQLRNSVDLILASMKVEEDPKQFEKSDNLD
jgi:hypothetical protein